MKLQLKRSNVLESGKAKEPTASQVEYGELCVNYNDSDPAIFIKDNSNNIIRIAGSGDVGSGEVPSGELNPSGNLKVGELFFNTIDDLPYYWNGSEWVAIHGDDFYVNVDGDNMTGNLTLGGDKITLDATAGSAEFGGSITADGSAEFGGSVSSTTYNGYGQAESYQILSDGAITLTKDSGDKALRIFQSGAGSASGERFFVKGNGSAEFAGTVTADTFSGSLPYGDLTGAPTIPTNNNQLTNGAGYITNASIPTNNNQLTNGAGYVTSSGNTVIGSDTDLDTSGSQVVDKLTLTDGVITAHSKRTLTLGQLGYTGATNANYITNNNQLTNGAGYVTSSGNTVIGTDSDINTSGAKVVDKLNMTKGVITSHTTRTLTLANLGYTGATNANYITNNNQLTNGAGYYKSGSNVSFGNITMTGTFKGGNTLNISTDAGDGIFANTSSGNPIKIHSGGIKRNKGRDTRQYGNYGAHYISEGSSNNDGRIGLCRNATGGPAGIHFGKTGNYSTVAPAPLDENTLYYPVAANSQSLMALSSYFGDNYQMVLGARIQTNTIGAVTPGTGVGAPGKAETNMTFDVMDDEGNFGSPSTLSLNAKDLFVNTVNGLTLNQPDQGIVFTDRGSSKLTYEEGSWNPTIKVGGTEVIPGTQGGYYTRIGRQVYLTGRILNVDLAGLTGKLNISNLPFQVSGNATGSISDQGAGQVTLYKAVGSPTSYGVPFIRTEKAEFSLYVCYMSSDTLNQSSNDLQTGQAETFFADTSHQFRFTCTYIAKE